MDRFEIKKTIEALLLSCPMEEEFPDEILSLLENNCEVLAANTQHQHDINAEEKRYFNSTGSGVAHFVVWLVKSQERKIKKMSGRSKVGLWNLIVRTQSIRAIQCIHALIHQDIIDYVMEQRGSHV